jgi:structural maintenance of chromosome 2
LFYILQAKKINKKVMGMIEKAEGEYIELLRKRKVVENDKKKIQAVIEELDVKKKSELQRTWIKVNRDFGSIFSTLLPGAKAKLEPPEGMEAWEGLAVKVAFGDVWKESLSELSGGQRSLLALSLILSLLLFKPAPMYILDEVDAALDLSHTQNIGNMLRTHFSQSQFIVVSLKVCSVRSLSLYFFRSISHNLFYRRECSTTPTSSTEPSSSTEYPLLHGPLELGPVERVL